MPFDWPARGAPGIMIAMARFHECFPLVSKLLPKMWRHSMIKGADRCIQVREVPVVSRIRCRRVKEQETA
jgi:hypothetical protein